MSLDLEVIRQEFLRQCGSCDYGIYPAACTCPSRDYRPTMLALVEEVDRLRAELLAEKADLIIARTKLVTQAWQPGDPVYPQQCEWIDCACGTRALWQPEMPDAIQCPECGGTMSTRGAA